MEYFMYYLLLKEPLYWSYRHIPLLDDNSLIKLIDIMHVFSPYDVSLHFTMADAKTFEGLLTTISDEYFGSNLKAVLEDFQNCLILNNLDLILRLEDIKALPFQDREIAMDDLIKKIQKVMSEFQFQHYMQFNKGQSGPLY